MIKKLLSGLIFCFTACMLPAQNSGEIIGKLTDSLSGDPVIGAGVSLEQNGVIINQIPTEPNGAFYFKPLQPGNYDLKISCLGYRPVIVEDVYVSGTQITYLNLDLAQTSFLYDSAVVISWIDERNIINEIPIIGTAELKHATGRDVTSIVAKTVPVIYSPDGGDGGIYIAGSRADATLYVIDGVRVDGSAYIPKSAIQEVAVYTAGIPAKYGDVTGGVIEITTKSYSGIY